MLRLTSRRSAQIGVSVLFLVLVRSIAEYFRLQATLGADRAAVVYASYPAGLLIAALGTWAAVLLYFADRYRPTIAVVCSTVVALLLYKAFVIR